jgi:hypothetical protein
VRTDRGGPSEVEYIYSSRDREHEEETTDLRNRSGAPVVTSDHGSRQMDSHSRGRSTS